MPSETRFPGPPDPWAYLWKPALADLRAMNGGIAEALAGSRLAEVGADGVAVVLVRDGHTAANERLRCVIGRTLAAVGRGKGMEVRGVVMEEVES